MILEMTLMGNDIHACLYGLHDRVLWLSIKNKKGPNAFWLTFAIIFTKKIQKVERVFESS